MQNLRLRVKKEFILVCAGDVEGVNIELTLKKGEEYDVNMRGINGWPIVYVKGEDYDMAFDDEENEFWEYWEFAPMTELDFREIFDADNLTMESIRDDVAFKECGLGYYDMACSHMLESELDARGLALNEEIMTSESVIEYIMQMRHNGSRYTLEDWIKDTKENYSESFK